MPYKLLRFWPTAAFHLGGNRLDYEASSPMPTADGLHAALDALMAKLGHAVYGLDESPWAFGGCFPWIAQRLHGSTALVNTLWLLPKPYRMPRPRFAKGTQGQQAEEEDALLNRKKYKKVAWWPAEHFSYLLKNHGMANNAMKLTPHGEWLVYEDWPKKLEDHLRYQGQALGAAEWLTEEVQTRVRVPRNPQSGHDPEPYYVSKWHYRNDDGWATGFYALAWAATEAAWDPLQKLMTLLGEEGLGTDRALGLGRFTITLEDVPNALEPQAKAMPGSYGLALGQYLPKDANELKEAAELGADNPKAGWELVRRSGWYTGPNQAPRPRPAVHFLNAGSVLRLPDTATNEPYPLMGRDVNLAPVADGHPVYRRGRAVLWPLGMLND